MTGMSQQEKDGKEQDPKEGKPVINIGGEGTLAGQAQLSGTKGLENSELSSNFRFTNLLIWLL